MYLDSSAIVAIIASEPDRDDLLRRLARAETCTTSVVTVFETIAALARKTGDRASAPRQVRQFLRAVQAHVLPVSVSCSEFLVHAFHEYHRGSGHRAKLNFGDCITYAVAKEEGLRILYKGDDFAHTDMA